jgi:hypothetical protein
MKTNNAWGWLAAAVLAAGLNASYHDGGLEWAHRIADRVGNRSAAVLALASGRADQFLAEAQVIKARHEAPSCPFAATMARVEARMVEAKVVQARIARSQVERFDAMSAREEAELAKLEANRARIEAQTARFRIPAAAFTPVLLRVSGASICPRVRVNVPQIPAMKLPPLPAIHIETASAGPV